MKIQVVLDKLFITVGFAVICCQGSFLNNVFNSFTNFGNNVDSRGIESNSIVDWQPKGYQRKEKHPIERHAVQTEDGYILNIHRIRGGPNSVPVFIQHGLLESSMDWLVPAKNQSLAYILAANGFDVWLGNARGNTHSKRHSTLGTNDPRFWNFSWHELGYYDLPAVINYITGLRNKTLHYIGHSMGATTFSVMAIERPELQLKVRTAIALAPAVYVNHLKGPVRLLARFRREIKTVAYNFRVNQFMPRIRVMDVFARDICTREVFKTSLCAGILFFMSGFSPYQLNATLVPEIWKGFPAGTSMKLLDHWLQQIEVNEFRKYDYGSVINRKVYGTDKPPYYDISRIKVPTAVFWGQNDALIGKEDAFNFYRQLPNKIGIFKVADDSFNHFDFLWGLDAPELVYSKIIQIFRSYSLS